MLGILKNLKPYWRSVIVIIALLVVQAWCDLSLPAYTSNIIDVGIQNSGIEHIFPEKISKAEFENAKILMTEEEANIWNQAYLESSDVMELKTYSDKELSEFDSKMLTPILMNYQMKSVGVDEFKSMIYESVGKKTGMDEETFMKSDINDLAKQFGIEVDTFKAYKENSDGASVETECVDVRLVMAQMLEKGMMDSTQLFAIRAYVNSMFESMGETVAKSMGVYYAIECNKAAGVDVNLVQKRYLWIEGLKMVALALLMGVVTVLVGFFGARVGAGVGRDLREKMYKKVVGFSNNEMNKFQTASLITRTTNDIQQIQMVTSIFLRMIAYAPILGIGGIIKVLETKAGMGWIIVLAILVVLGVVSLLMAVAMPKFKLMQKLVDGINLISREILTGLNVIRAFGREKEEEKRFDDENVKLTKTTLFTNRVMTFMMPAMMIIMNAITVLIVWVAAHKINDGVLQVGQMTAFITYAVMIVMSFLMLTMLSVMLPRAAVAAGRITEVLETEATVKDENVKNSLGDVKGEVKFENVSFMYPGACENALEDISFIAKPGEVTAIIGSTGCGKSTLINLIPRLYDVTAGSISIDGKDIRTVSLKELRSKIGFVPQKGVLFSGTIASNLRFGNSKASDEEIKNAAEIAQAKEFIEEKSKKYNSEIAQGGTNVSGGQKQRLAIARAIVKNPAIYVFDDSFSALDLKTDAKLRNELAKVTEDKTVIIVAQRISTILHANQILVIEDGRIVGKGTHEELIKNCEEYLQIARSQLSEKELGLEKEGSKISLETREV